MKPPRSSVKQGLSLLSLSVEDDSDQEWEIDGNGAIREMAQRIQLQQGIIYSFSGNTHATYLLVYITHSFHGFLYRKLLFQFSNQ